MHHSERILITSTNLPHAWINEPQWYADAFRAIGCEVIPFHIPFPSTHTYAPYPSAHAVLRYRLQKLIQEYSPTVAFIISGGGYWTREMIADLREANIFVAYYNPDDPMLFDAVSRHLAPACDCVFAFPKVQETYRRELDIETRPFFYCVDPAIEHGPDPECALKKKYAADIVVTGNIDTERKKRRGEYLKALSQAGIGTVAYYGPNRIHELEYLRHIYRGEIADHAEQNFILRSAKIVFHYAQELLPHEQKSTLPDSFQSVSGRLLDGAAAGCLVMTNYFADLEKVFAIGEEIVVYDSIEDAIGKARYYVHHEEEREQIAWAGQWRVLSEHTVHHRAQYVLDVIQSTIRMGALA